MKLLVTGAPGYIGSHFVKKCAEYGHEIFGIDINWNQNDVDKYLSQKIIWDIRLPIEFNYRNNYDAVVHLAAMTMVQPSVLNPYLYYTTNINGTKNVIDAVDTDHFIYCSTGASFNPSTSPYAMSKRAAEDLLTNNENYSILRFYNVGGNDGFKKYDETHYHLIRKAAAVINGLYNELEVYGTDYDTRDGTTIRNYTHVTDIVDSMIKILHNGPTKNIECLGNTTGHTVLEIIDTMKRVSGVDFNVSFKQRRLGDSIVSLLPSQSRFFTENHTIEQQCLSALEYEK